MISIKQPAEKEKSEIDSCIAISDLYNKLCIQLRNNRNKESKRNQAANSGRVTEFGLEWGTSSRMTNYLDKLKWLSISGIGNVISVLNDIEAGLIDNVDFVECLSCIGGCTGGSLTVENIYVARSRLVRHSRSHPGRADKLKEDQIREAFNKGYFNIKAALLPRPVGKEPDIFDAVSRFRQKELLLSKLPGTNCGLCGTATCEDFAQDVTDGDAEAELCIIHPRFDWERLYRLYSKGGDPDGAALR